MRSGGLHYRACCYQALVKLQPCLLLVQASRKGFQEPDHTRFSTESWRLTRAAMVSEMGRWGLGVHRPVWSESAALLSQVCQQMSPAAKPVTGTSRDVEPGTNNQTLWNTSKIYFVCSKGWRQRCGGVRPCSKGRLPAFWLQERFEEQYGERCHQSRVCNSQSNAA